MQCTSLVEERGRHFGFLALLEWLQNLKTQRNAER